MFLAQPPISHVGDFEMPFDLLGANFGYSLDDDDDDEDESDDESGHYGDGLRSLWRNKATLFGNMTKVTTVSESQSFLFKENRCVINIR